MSKKEVYLSGKYVFLAITAVLVIISYFIVKDYLVSIISAFILAYLVKPIFHPLSKKIGRPLSATLCVILILVIIILPFLTIIEGIPDEAYLSISNTNLNTFTQKISSYPLISSLNLNLNDLTAKIVSIFISMLTSLFSYIPSLVLSIFITLLSTYFILINWNYLAEKIEEFIPFEDKKKIIVEIAAATNHIVYGSFFVAIINFLVAVLGFWLLGIKLLLLLTALIALTTFPPGIGPEIVWTPMALYYLANSNYQTATGVILTGLIISILTDNILRYKLIGKKTKINPFILLIGVLGGISFFGIFGFIIGPLILAYTIKIVEASVKQK